jgi:hypothetical protein
MVSNEAAARVNETHSVDWTKYGSAVANLASEQVLSLVQQALDELDDRPIDVSVRRAARIASLLGDTVFAVYLGMELKPSGGHPPGNAADTRRLMADPSLWSDSNGPVEEALTIYQGVRAITDGPDKGKIDSNGLAQIEALLATVGADEGLDPLQKLQLTDRQLSIRERVRHTVFAALCEWERQLTYANVNERIFDRFRSRVDGLLAQGAPAVLDQFSAVYRRLREATKDPAAPLTEDLAQAVTTCRRILKAVADHLLPGIPGAATETGASLNDAAYRNRIYQFIKDNVASEATADTVKAALGGLYDRFAALDKLANKGVHAELGIYEAELCAISTYLVAGELLALGEPPGGQGKAQPSSMIRQAQGVD